MAKVGNTTAGILKIHQQPISFTYVCVCVCVCLKEMFVFLQGNKAFIMMSNHKSILYEATRPDCCCFGYSSVSVTFAFVCLIVCLFEFF